ncbi:MAG: hypothetical protein K8I00_09130, partial [Candidatus Omnitrophica bacterium]|nr:hypothetical protein [Candidatus Omnitrophota bacterium]
MNDLVLLKSFYHKHDAELAVGLLHDAGIEAVLQADASGNNRVMVLKKDLKRAENIIVPVHDELFEEKLKQAEKMALESGHPSNDPIGETKKIPGSVSFLMIIAATFIIFCYFRGTYEDIRWMVFPDPQVKCQPVEGEGGRVEECKAYYTSGQLMGVRFYQRDKVHGPSKKYYYNGQLEWEGTYLN